jgi:hypothetical protein
MSVIIAVAYDEVLRLGPPAVSWQELKLSNVIPAQVASTLLPQFQRWRKFVEPIFEKGDIVGIRISSLMSPRLARRLRAKVEPFLKPRQDASATAAREAVPEKRVVSLSKHGLWIPERNLAHAKSVLEQLADIELQYDPDEVNVVALLIPPGVPLGPIYAVLKVVVVTVQAAHASQRLHLLDLLQDEMLRLDAAPLRRP